MRTKIPPAKKLKKYIQLQSPLTLDKYKDGTAQMRLANELQELTNYIPCSGYIYTREGVIDVDYTPETTVTYPFPESGESPPIPVTPPTIPPTYEITRCRMVLDFERGNDYIGWNSMLYATGINPVFTAMKCPNYVDAETGITGQATCTGVGATVSKAGNNSLCINSAPASNPYASSPGRSYGLYVRGGDVPPSWLFTGSSEQTCILLTYWLYPLDNTGENDHIIVIHSNIGGHFHSVLFRHYDTDFQIEWMISNGGTYSDDATSFVNNLSRWYFCAGWMDVSNKTHGIYIYDDVAKTEKWTSSKTLTINNTHHLWAYATSSAMLSISGYRFFDVAGGGYISDNSHTMRGNLDYITYWDAVPTNHTSVITLIRLIRDLHKAP